MLLLACQDGAFRRDRHCGHLGEIGVVPGSRRPLSGDWRFTKVLCGGLDLLHGGRLLKPVELEGGDVASHGEIVGNTNAGEGKKGGTFGVDDEAGDLRRQKLEGNKAEWGVVGGRGCDEASTRVDDAGGGPVAEAASLGQVLVLRPRCSVGLRLWSDVGKKIRGLTHIVRDQVCRKPGPASAPS